MKQYLSFLLMATLLSPVFSFAQQPGDANAAAPAENKENMQTQNAPSKPRGLSSGFYFKFGPTFPVGKYRDTQVLFDTNFHHESVYYPAKIGAAMDIGFLIYIGPAFANNHIRVGIDATFLSFSFNSIQSDTIASPTTKYWYYYLGQKFGPVISIRPIDRLVIDVSYKMNAYVAYVHHWIHGKYNDEWGKNLTQSEISMNVRYSIMLFAFQYNFGKTEYNDFDSSKPTHYVDNSTYRIMIGFKF